MKDTQNVNQIIKEELDKIVKSAEKKYPQIKKDLEDMRKKVLKDVPSPDLALGVFGPDTDVRVQITTVAQILDVPVSELMLYFINTVKTNMDRSSVEYHMGNVHFRQTDN